MKCTMCKRYKQEPFSSYCCYCLVTIVRSKKKDIKDAIELGIREAMKIAYKGLEYTENPLSVGFSTIQDKGKVFIPFRKKDSNLGK